MDVHYAIKRRHPRTHMAHWLTDQRRRLGWFILFAIVLTYNVAKERQYLFVFYTQWTFLLETIYFGCRLVQWDAPADHIWPILFAPSVVVCVGFWVVVAPIHLSQRPPNNMFMLVVSHGCNMMATISERRHIWSHDVWKPILYTAIYNLFLAVYVDAGGRSVSGKLPYWFAHYDTPIGWVFAALAVTAVALAHFMMSRSKTHELAPKQYIV
jgi:hypothetical protein